ncbi:MAG: hypothetical protein LBR22_06500 [Desulfovibrio sp.]|jgi:hypothetical protein|nr:hypothetical protein [Desulfovibrio sp.]
MSKPAEEVQRTLADFPSAILGDLRKAVDAGLRMAPCREIRLSGEFVWGEPRTGDPYEICYVVPDGVLGESERNTLLCCGDLGMRHRFLAALDARGDAMQVDPRFVGEGLYREEAGMPGTMPPKEEIK